MGRTLERCCENLANVLDPARNPGAGPGGGAVFTGLTASRKDTVGLGEAGGVFEQRRSAAFSVLVMSYIYCA